MDDWQRSLQLFRQMLWLWNLRDSKFETQRDRTIAGVIIAIFSWQGQCKYFRWPKCLFSQGNRWISDSKDDRLICAPICTVSQVHFELQGVASGISYLVSARARGTSLDRHPSPCVRYSRPRKTIWFFNSRNEHVGNVGINHTVSEFSRQLNLLHIEVFLEVFTHRRLSVPMLGTWQKAMSQAVPVPSVLISLRWTLALELLEPWHLLGLDGWTCLDGVDGGRNRQVFVNVSIVDELGKYLPLVWNQVPRWGCQYGDDDAQCSNHGLRAPKLQNRSEEKT